MRLGEREARAGGEYREPQQPPRHPPTERVPWQPSRYRQTEGLIDQMTSSYGNKFTEAQAEYAANAVGL
jgi:hypothetical protein